MKQDFGWVPIQINITRELCKLENVLHLINQYVGSIKKQSKLGRWYIGKLGKYKVEYH